MFNRRMPPPEDFRAEDAQEGPLDWGPVFTGNDSDQAELESTQHPVRMFEDQGNRDQGGPGHQGIRTNSGELDLIARFIDESVNRAFHTHIQENATLHAITDSLQPDRNVLTRSLGAGSFDGGPVALAAVVAPNVAGPPQKVVDARHERRQLIIYNTSAVAIFLSKFSAVNGSDFSLAPNTSLILNARCEVWAASAGAAATLQYIETWDNE